MTVFPGSTGDIFWGGINGPRCFTDPMERLTGILFVQASCPSRAAAESRDPR